MNTFWLKVAGIVVVVVGLIILVNIFTSSESEPEAEPVAPKTVYDMWEQDEQRLRAEPAVESFEETEQQPTKKPTELVEPHFVELSLEKQVEAERLFEWALAQRKMGRLPGMTGTSYQKMVDACRQIIQKFPGSEFDYKARRMLADMPSRHRERYRITEEETDLTGFFK